MIRCISYRAAGLKLHCRIFLLILCFGWFKGHSQRPYSYWTFDEKEGLKDLMGANVFDAAHYKCEANFIEGGIAKGISLNKMDCPSITGGMRTKVKAKLTIEFLFNGDKFSFLCFPTPFLNIVFSYSFLQFRTNTIYNNEKEVDDWIIELNGTDRNSYNYISDGNWHHFVFIVDADAGEKQIWIDGILSERCSKKIKPNSTILLDDLDGFQFTDKIDEVALYNDRISTRLIAQHYDEFQRKLHYSFQINNKLLLPAAIGRKERPVIDTLDFAPGYPNYTIQAINQLQQFPLPRFARENPTHPNFPWMDITYLHRELPGNGGHGFGDLNPVKAVSISEELAKNWHYSIELPCYRSDSLFAMNEYKNPNSVAGALLKFANINPQYSTATVLMQAQINPTHAGFARGDCFMGAQDLPDNYYLQNGLNKPIIFEGKKWLSPRMPLDIIANDGKVSAFYLRQLKKYLNRPLDYINENGEIFGHLRPDELLKSDPTVGRQQTELKFNNAQYNGWFQFRIDSCYKAELLVGSGCTNSFYTLYDVSAANPEYWPDYNKRRNINTSVKGNHYSTPSFYPAFPENWINNTGSYNGYGVISRGRATEIALGDKLFAPFVSAGWSKEEKNIRPAQWLALLKSMVMLGADFFHVGYFNVTGSTGWPDGIGPNDPRGYIYQVTIPAYAQAIGSRFFDFLEAGNLLKQANSNDKIHQFRFKGQNENELIMVRQLGKKFLIYGSIQPNSNLKGNIPEKKLTSILLDGQHIQFEIRKQASMYFLDKSNVSNPVFFQIDAWQEATHPWYWSKQICIEAEMPDNLKYAEQRLVTEKPTNDPNDYSSYITFVRLGKTDKGLEYDFDPRKKQPLFCYVRARTSRGASIGAIKASIKKGKSVGLISNISKEWNWYEVKWNTGGENEMEAGAQTLILQLVEGEVDIDKILLAQEPLRQ